MRPIKSGRKSEITATTKPYIGRSVITGKLKTEKDVQRYLCDIKFIIDYSACLKLLKSMGFQARIKKHKPFLKVIRLIVPLMPSDVKISNFLIWKSTIF
ncbi:hypothetical protein G6F44_013736 [Rhizopus delemar]|nr:hypothetical protein G6F44_013736 [Rhizopus delemar]